MVLLITDSFLKLQKVNKASYFLPQISVLNSENIHDFEILWSVDKPLNEAALVIKNRILNSTTPVTIVAHGKGGLDAVECLIQNPDLQEKVEKLITLQSPFWGTPFADFLVGHPLMGAITLMFCKFTGCNIKTLEELSELNRQVYMIINKTKIERLMQNVDVVSVGTRFEAPMLTETFFQRAMKRIRTLVQNHGGVNDGLIPLFSTKISTEPHVELQNATHLSLVTPNLTVGPEIQNLTKNLLRSVKPLGLSGYPTKFPWGPFEASSGSKHGRPYQSEIS